MLGGAGNPARQHRVANSPNSLTPVAVTDGVSCMSESNAPGNDCSVRQHDSESMRDLQPKNEVTLSTFACELVASPHNHKRCAAVQQGLLCMPKDLKGRLAEMVSDEEVRRTEPSAPNHCGMKKLSIPKSEGRSDSFASSTESPTQSQASRRRAARSHRHARRPQMALCQSGDTAHPQSCS